MANSEDTSKTFRLVCQLNRNDCGPAALCANITEVGFLLILFMLCLSLGVSAQDLKGRIYECRDVEKMRSYFIYKMENDPEEKSKEKTQQQRQREREQAEMYFSLFDITAKVVFKNKNKFVIKMDIDVAKEITIKGKGVKRKLSWTERAAIAIGYKPLLSLLAREMKEERVYEPNRTPLFHEDNIKLVMKSNGSLLEFTDQSFVIPLRRVK